MLRVSLTVQIPDLDKRLIEVECPRCCLHTYVRLGEIRRRDFAICRGCHATVRLDDHLGTFHRFTRTFTRTLNSLGGSHG